MTMGEKMRRGYNDFSLRISSSLSLKYGCIVLQKLIQGFLSEQSLLLLWVMMVYIVQVKGKKVTLKILQAKCLVGTLRDGLSREVLTKCSLALDSSTSNMCFSREPLLANFLQASCEIALIFISSLILHQFNTKPNTSKSHKIQ